MKSNSYKITVIGGGTGSFTILSGLKKLKNIQLTAIVPSTDDGGSSGRLKDEFGYLPTGDIRQCLVALADEREQPLLRELFTYRFDKGEAGLKGHSFGNLLLTALTDIYGGELEAVAKAKELLDIKGDVLPVSLQKAELVAKYENGEKLIGEHLIDAPGYPHDGQLHIKQLSIQPQVQTYPQVREAVSASDLIVMGPGDLYTSLFANLVVTGVTQAIQKSSARLVYIVNLMTKFGQTTGFSAQDHIAEVEKYLGQKLNHILINHNNLPVDILARYKLENAEPVQDDLGDDPRVIRTDLLAREVVKTAKGDVLHRSLIRHDSTKIASAIAGLLGAKMQLDV